MTDPFQKSGARADMEALVGHLATTLSSLFDAPVTIAAITQLAGGASKEAWSVDAATPAGVLELLIRRASGGVIFSETLSLEHEYRLLQAAFQAGVRVPRPYGYVPELAGREAFVMERIRGEAIGRRVVSRPELAGVRTGLPLEMAGQLAPIHGIARDEVDFLKDPGGEAARSRIATYYLELDALEEPHPVIELGLRWLLENAPVCRETVVTHGDFRVGNLMVDSQGLTGVLDWEFAHIGDPAEDLGWPLVRAWRFGVPDLRLGGIGGVEPYLERYNQLTGRAVSLSELRWWELFGNVRWAIGSLTQARRHLRREERSVELAVLGRLAAEVEHEILSLLEEGYHAG